MFTLAKSKIFTGNQLLRSISHFMQFLIFILLIGGNVDSINALDTPLHLDISTRQIEIDATFSGTSLLLFGATDRRGDIIVILRGPNRTMVLRRKDRKAGIWVNHNAMYFKSVPQFYTVAASQNPELLLSKEDLIKYEIGAKNIFLNPSQRASLKEEKSFRAALLRVQANHELFPPQLGHVQFIDDNLFRVTVDIPANIPTGDYSVEALLISNGELITKKTITLTVEKSGFSDQIWTFAHSNSEIYALIAVIISLFTGWIGSVTFRKV